MGDDVSDETVDVIDAWLTRLLDELGLAGTVAVDRALVLDLARDAAHGIARPAAPLTTFLVGLAAGMSGGSSADIQRAAEIATAALGQP
jgi:hypothetical protein